MPIVLHTIVKYNTTNTSFPHAFFTRFFIRLFIRLFHLHHDQGHDQGDDHDQGHDQGHDHDQGRGVPVPGSDPPLIMIMTLIVTLIMIMTLIMTLIMMKQFYKVSLFSDFGSCPWPTAKANSRKTLLAI